MPKRKNPFGDTAPIQLKTHIGFKQAATEKEKQEVYGEGECKGKSSRFYLMRTYICREDSGASVPRRQSSSKDDPWRIQH